MLLSREIRRKLAALRSESVEAAVTEEPGQREAAGPLQLVSAPDQMPPGREVEGDLGQYFSARVEPAWVGNWAQPLTAGVYTELDNRAGFPFREPHQVTFIDIETTGLSSLPLFLVGLLHTGARGPHLHQFLARDYSEEPAVLAAAVELLSQTRLLVSFNGRSFDLPYMKDRLRYHRLNCSLEVAEHWDVLLTARRLLRQVLPDRRLLTLEEHLCGRRRLDDIPGHEIPRAYHDFVATGDDFALARILYHNQVDLLTTAQLAALWIEHAPVSNED